MGVQKLVYNNPACDCECAGEDSASRTQGLHGQEAQQYVRGAASQQHCAAPRRALLAGSCPSLTLASTSSPPPAVHLNANRHVTGTLRGFDQFMNLVLDNAVDEKLKVDIGMIVIRGNSISTVEALESIREA